MLFHQDNALCHKLIAMMAKLHELQFKLLLQPTLFSRSGPQQLVTVYRAQKNAPGERFRSIEELISETEAYFEAKHKSFSPKGIELLEKRWNHCITLKGDHVDE